MNDQTTWGAYGSNLEPLVELDDGNTFTELAGCHLLLARPAEAKHAQESGRRPHRSVGERRHFDLESIVEFALQHGYFNEDNDEIDEPEDSDE